MQDTWRVHDEYKSGSYDPHPFVHHKQLVIKEIAALHGCDTVLVDVGANRGDTVIRWFNTTFNEVKLSPQQLRASCVISFEANPKWTETLLNVQRQIRRDGFQFVVFTETVAHSSFGNLDFHVDKLSEHSWSSSLIADKRLKMDNPNTQKALLRRAKGDHTAFKQKLSLPSVDLGYVLKAMRGRFSNATIYLKMDIEGAEYEILRDLIVTGNMCSTVTHLYIEWHSQVRRSLGLPVGIDEFIEDWVSSDACGIQVTRADRK